MYCVAEDFKFFSVKSLDLKFVSMVMMVLWGHLSPQLLQKVMLLYKADLKLLAEGCLDLKGVDALAKMGSNGTYSENVWRDFLKLLPKPKLPRLQLVRFPSRLAKLRSLCRCSCHTLCFLQFTSTTH